MTPAQQREHDRIVASQTGVVEREINHWQTQMEGWRRTNATLPPGRPRPPIPEPPIWMRNEGAIVGVGRAARALTGQEPYSPAEIEHMQAQEVEPRIDAQRARAGLESRTSIRARLAGRQGSGGAPSGTGVGFNPTGGAPAAPAGAENPAPAQGNQGNPQAQADALQALLARLAQGNGGGGGAQPAPGPQDPVGPNTDPYANVQRGLPAGFDRLRAFNAMPRGLFQQDTSERSEAAIRELEALTREHGPRLGTNMPAAARERFDFLIRDLRTMLHHAQ